MTARNVYNNTPIDNWPFPLFTCCSGLNTTTVTRKPFF